MQVMTPFVTTHLTILGARECAASGEAWMCDLVSSHTSEVANGVKVRLVYGDDFVLSVSIVFKICTVDMVAYCTRFVKNLCSQNYLLHVQPHSELGAA